MEVPPPISKRYLLKNAVECGSGAAVLSAAVLALCTRRDQKKAVGGLDGPGRSLWGETRTRRATRKKTLGGYLAHYAESVLWGAVYTAAFRDARGKPISQIVAEAASASTAAFVVDYYSTTKRLQPRFEKHVSAQSMVATYAGFALGLAAVTFLRRNGR